MTNEELQLLKDLFSTVGSVSSAGFDAMVRYTFASGLTWLIAGVVAFMVSMTGVLVGIFKEFADDDWNGALVFGGGLVALVSLLVIGANLVDVIEPAGATVRELLDKTTR
jgi:hypothetical protein